MTDLAIAFRWENGALKPTLRFQDFCSQRFTEGEAYRLVIVEDASAASRGHYFAQLKDMYDSLPESMSGRFPSSEHLRKWALCRSGYADEHYIDCKDENEARRIAGFVQSFDDFAIIVVRGNTVRVYHAKSQSAQAMGKKDFQESKDKVFGIINDLLENRESAVKAAEGEGSESGQDNSLHGERIGTDLHAGTGAASGPSPAPGADREVV